MDLLFTMCSEGNVRDVVQELLNYLEVADFSMREELVLKTAILAERFASGCLKLLLPDILPKASFGWEPTSDLVFANTSLRQLHAAGIAQG